MSIQEEVPPLNPWPFLIGDAVLLITATVISLQSNAPLTGLPLMAVTGCVGLGAVLAVIPFLLNHTRRQDLALADRQREIAALAQTTATSAEQISIAASSLHSIAESTTRALKLAEQLPHKMQERINDFKAQLNEVAVTENEALSQEINTLRTSETERLETALSGVRKTAADLAMIEAISRKHLSELNESLSRFVLAAEKAASESTRTIETARANAEKSITAALAGVDRKLASLPESIGVHSIAPFSSPAPGVAVAPVAAKAGVESKPAIETKPVVAPLVVEPKPVVVKTVVETKPAVSKSVVTPPVAAIDPSPISGVSRPPMLAPAPGEVAKKLGTVPPIGVVKAEPADSIPLKEDVATPAAEEKPARKRLVRKTAEADDELSLGLDLPSSDTPRFMPEISAPAVSSDGQTRLLVTAYIGIGNKLFVRGEGAGLSWSHGVPLQFVSIGKWRWESDISEAVKLKLYKNDELECVAVGTLALQPGYQQEVTASFS